MKVYKKNIPYKTGDEFDLIFFSDIHWGAAACDENGFERMLKRYGKKEKTLFLSNGDLFNCITARDKRFNITELQPRYVGKKAFITDYIMDCADLMRAHTTPDQWLGLGTGNHEIDLTETAQYDALGVLSAILGKEWCEATHELGYDWYYGLVFQHDGGGATRTYSIYANHGWSGPSRSEGAGVSKYAATIKYYMADLYAFAHTHGLWQHAIEVIVPSYKSKQLKIVPQDRFVVECGTRLKTLSDTIYPTYSEQRGYSPKRMGEMKIKLTPRSDSPNIGVETSMEGKS